MNKLTRILLPAIAVMFCVSCIEYDMSYPRVVAEFAKFDVEGARNVTLDPSTLTVSIELDETVRLDSVRLKEVVLAENVVYKNEALPEVLDLTSPQHVMLSLYQDYRWTITATQPVERYIRCANQVGEAVFSEQLHEAFIYVSKSQRLKFLKVSDMKLELLGSYVLSEEGPCEFPATLDFTTTRTFKVVSRGDTTTWKVSAVPVEVPAQITGVAPWCWSADVYATYDGVSEAPSLIYRKMDETSEWINLADSLIVVDGVNVSAHIDSLEQATEYEVKLIFKDEELPGRSFMTETPAQLPNFGFDDWWLNGKVWYVYGENYPAEDRVWDTANPGAASLIGSLTYPDETDFVKGKSLRMESKYAVVKFAAGNLYTGAFKQLVGTSGADLDWGTPFTSKPKALRGYFKYNPALVNYIENTPVASPSEYDQCQIQVVVTDTEKPFRVLPIGSVNGPTYDGEMVDLNTSPYVMGRGVCNYGSTEGEWVEFELPIDYPDPTRKPTYVIVTCASSHLGDYFTGGEGSVMLVDEFEFVYQ